VRKLQVSALALLLLLTACSVNQWLVSGKVLDEVGQQFLATGKMYDTLLANKQVTVEEYRVWATFANRFKAVYPSVVVTWNTAQESGKVDQAADAILTLKNELLAFYLTAQAKGGGV
jgi:hypothetical protein